MMDVPTQVPYNTIPAGGVCTADGITWLMVQSTTMATNLKDGSAVTITNSSQPYTYFPTASVCFA